MAAGSRRIAALAVLERLRRHEMESEARELALLRGEVARIEAQRTETLDDMNRNAHVTMIEAAPYLGDYIRAVRAEVAGLDERLGELDEKCATLEDEVRERYRSMRTVGTLLQTQRAKALADRQKAEAARLDEQAIGRWRRRRA
ncbi:MAG: hypothetical protein ACU0AT_05160 [Tranquillimonas sp.]|jgi:flagellar biosynthesis chaperone FliJ